MMIQEHGEPLSAVDASFLAREGAASHMHVGGLMLFRGSPPSYEELVAHVGARLHLVPRYRQRLSVPRLESGRPIWVDDVSFNLRYHVRYTALPSPGSDEQLKALTASIHSERLDRATPLWRLWLVTGLAAAAGNDEERFALVAQVHHALADGVACAQMAALLFDASPIPPQAPTNGEPWVPRPQPGTVELAARRVRDFVRAPVALSARAVRAAHREELITALGGLGEVVRAGLAPAPETPLNVTIGPHRRLALVHRDLSELKRVKAAFDATVNDVVLAAVSGALRRWLIARGQRPVEGQELRALVPVSIRGDADHGRLGNRLALIRARLPVHVADPGSRLRTIKATMDCLKASKQSAAVELLAAIQGFLPPPLRAQASRLNFSTRLFNLIVTNVPGPQFPLYVSGRQLTELYPIAFLPDDHALSVAILSYNGRVSFGLLGDHAAMPDLDMLAACVDHEMTELLEAAAARRSRPRLRTATLVALDGGR